MRIVIAPDSFKGTLTADQAAAAIAGAAGEFPGVIVSCCPVADGGEGTARILGGKTGTAVPVLTEDPLGRPHVGEYVECADLKTRAVDLASAAGLGLVAPGERDPLRATTAGAGDIIAAALVGCRRLVVGLGGTATVDGGAGLLGRLGARFLDEGGRQLEPWGSDLSRVSSVELDEVRRRLGNSAVIAACDVNNPLLGELGAARAFAPQKGASHEEVKQLESRLARLANAYSKACGRDLASLPGAGAAGGVGAALAAIGARLEPGIDVVLTALGFAALVKGADLVITGEGRLDDQTAGGKAVAGVAIWCRRAGVPVVAIVGMIADGTDPRSLGLAAAFAASPSGPPDPDLAARQLEFVARQVVGLVANCVSERRAVVDAPSLRDQDNPR